MRGQLCDECTCRGNKERSQADSDLSCHRDYSVDLSVMLQSGQHVFGLVVCMNMDSEFGDR